MSSPINVPLPMATPLHAGDLRGTIYTFKKAGDTLPMHTHASRDTHITIVARGSLRVHGPVIGDLVINAGTVLDADDTVTHEFVALEDNSRIVNIIKKAQAV